MTEAAGWAATFKLWAGRAGWFAASVLVVAILGIAGRTDDPEWTAQAAPSPAPTPIPVGRFVVVNPTPDVARNIMLVDTATGKAWVYCTPQGGAQDSIGTWCAVE